MTANYDGRKSKSKRCANSLFFRESVVEFAMKPLLILIPLTPIALVISWKVIDIFR